MRKLQIVIDTSVFIAALRSRRGASHKLLLLLGDERFEINVSVPLVLEYEAAARRLASAGEISLSLDDIEDILDYICAVANRRKVYYLWRPVLKDPRDEMVLELAVTAGCEYIVTFNRKDFGGAEQFGLRVVTPAEFLREIGELL